MSVKNHLFRGAVFGLALMAGESAAQLYGICGVGALNLTGYLAVPVTAVDGAVVIDGSVDCGGLCGGGGSASGELNGPITIDGAGFTASSTADAFMYECGAGAGGFSTIGGASSEDSPRRLAHGLPFTLISP